MGNNYIVNVMDKIGFSCYDVVDVQEIVDLGSTFNVITGRGDMFIDKEYCVVRRVGAQIESIEYDGEGVNVYIERLPDPNTESTAA